MYNYNHFKRGINLKNKVEKCIIKVMVLILIGLIIYNILPNKKETVSAVENEVLEVQTLRAEADITEAILESSTEKAERYVTQVSNEIEYLTLKEQGTYSVSNQRVDEDAGWWSKTFNESSITVNMDYIGIFSIKTSNINISSQDGTVYIEYDPNNIYVASVELSNVVQSSKKDWFGKEYTNNEVLVLEDIAKQEIYSQLESDDVLRNNSCTNLNDYFTDMANKMEIDELSINGDVVIEKSYEFIDLGIIKHNHSNKGLDSVSYIVLHSTGCNDVTALQFYNNLNTYVQKREASANYYVDDVNVVEAIPNNMQAWHVYCDDPLLPVTNQNSIGIEICQFADKERQQKAIDNTVKFIKEVLMKKFPDAKLVMHRQVNVHTICPSIITDSEFTKLFN